MELQKKIDSLIQDLNFERVSVNDIPLLLYEGRYYKISLIKDFNSYVIEFAKNYDEALKGLFEDGDVYPISFGEVKLVSELHCDLIKYYLNNCTCQ
ncbi:hypothetical protein ACQKFM_23275 [Paenibacillus xylanexedens]|uniref:hypothetical protein n=1 Tax=Paenibacillus xylanexedens TaxID=528191 RepID=UPI003D072C22